MVPFSLAAKGVLCYNLCGKGGRAVEQAKGRIELLDALRGGALLVMIAHHICYDLCVFCGFPWVWFTNPVWNVLHYLDAGTFILLAGVSSDFSHSNLRRGARTLLVALVISAVTFVMDMPILFGVLHMMGVCMLLYGLTQPFWERLRQRIPPLIPIVSVLGILATAKLVNGYLSTVPHLWIFGLVTQDFYSSDYFPLLPWAFVFFFGTWLGKPIRERKLPRWFYTASCPPLAAVGRHSMLVYVAHQPVIYAVVMAVLFLLKR